jgi:hypothetical protein
MVPHACSATRQRRAFLIVSPSLSNSLPSDLRSLPHDFSGSFHKLLKTFLFGLVWPGSGAPLSSSLEGALYKFHR